MLDRLDPRVGADRHEQGPLDLQPGRVPARVGDAAAKVPALTGQDEIPLRVPVEGRADLDELPYEARALGHQRPHRLGIAQPGACDERVAHVLLGGVPWADGGSDAALGPPRRPGVEQILCDDEHAGTGAPQMQGGGQPCDPGPDDDDIGVDGPAGGRREQAAGNPNCGAAHAPGPWWTRAAAGP